jgi:hypothetical protein
VPYPSTTLYPGTTVFPEGGKEEGVTPNRLRVIEHPPMRQYLLATAPSGRVERWGEDELEATDVAEGLTESGAVPGGDKEIACSLPRKPGTDYSDMKVGTRVESFGAGGKLLRQCRLERAPRTSGDYLTMDPSAMGYQVLLTDDEGAREIFIDAEQGSWGDPSARRKEVMSPAKINVNAQVSAVPAGTPGSAGESLPSAISHAWGHYDNGGSLEPDLAESWYSVPGIELGRILVDFKSIAGQDSSWNDLVWSASTDTGEGANPLANVFGASQHLDLEVGPSQFHLYLQDSFEAAANAEATIECQWRIPKVAGRHGLPLYGTWPEVGLLASDVIAHALAKWAPGVRFSVGPFGSLRQSGFLIPHLVFKEPTTVQEMITAALKYELLEWSVKATAQGPTFFLNPRGEREGRMKWRARVRPAKLTETGQQMDQVWNRCIVSFTGFDGVQHTVGPGGSAAQFGSNLCVDFDPLNPINEAGEDRTKHIALNDPATPEGGAEAAQRFLEQCKLLDGSGEATLTGYVEDEHGAEWPYYCVQEGDLIDFIDSSIPGYRYVVEATASRSSRSTNIKIDAPPDSFEALLERLGARDAAAGIG